MKPISVVITWGSEPANSRRVGLGIIIISVIFIFCLTSLALISLGELPTAYAENRLLAREAVELKKQILDVRKRVERFRRQRAMSDRLRQSGVFEVETAKEEDGLISKNLPAPRDVMSMAAIGAVNSINR